MGICLEVWGDYALFTRPEMKAERVSYDMMTPSAARGLVESIFWHPGLSWIIDRIHVCKPLQFTNLRRNASQGHGLRQNCQNGDGTGERFPLSGHVPRRFSSGPPCCCRMSTMSLRPTLSSPTGLRPQTTQGSSKTS